MTIKSIVDVIVSTSHASAWMQDLRPCSLNGMISIQLPLPKASTMVRTLDHALDFTLAGCMCCS